ncbi:hypothetical protein ACFDTO_07670 [Microbacteriaceae bacterium 4G12]
MVTGDTIAVALIGYAEALAVAQLSASVEVPVRLEDGTADRAILLIGPASEMAAVHQPDDGGEIVDEALVAYLEAETAHLKTPPVAIVEDASMILDVPDDL